MKPQAIDWPEITVGGAKYTLRVSYASSYQLTLWGKNLASATAVELAAAMAGRFDDSGKWRSAGFERAVDLADLMEPGDETPVIAGCTDAIKKAYPEAEVTAQPVPVTTAQTPTDSSSSGLLQLQSQGSD